MDVDYELLKRKIIENNVLKDEADSMSDEDIKM